MTSFTRATPNTTRSSSSDESPELVSLLAEFFRHLSAGDADAAAASWDVPALILGDDHVHGPLSRDRLAQMLVDRPGPSPLDPSPPELPAVRDADVPLDLQMVDLQVERLEWTSRRVAAIDVRWTPLPHAGLLHGIEAATFLVRIDELGQPKIRGLVLHAESPGLRVAAMTA